MKRNAEIFVYLARWRAIPLIIAGATKDSVIEIDALAVVCDADLYRRNPKYLRTLSLRVRGKASEYPKHEQKPDFSLRSE